MNRIQLMVMEALQLGPLPATTIHGALALRGFKAPIEELYVELVSLEATQRVRVEGVYDGAGQRLGGVWALGHKKDLREPVAPEPVDVLRMLAQPWPNATVHRCE